jgi:hypothetical protein
MSKVYTDLLNTLVSSLKKEILYEVRADIRRHEELIEEVEQLKKKVNQLTLELSIKNQQGLISVKDAAEKYNTSKVTVYNKINLAALKPVKKINNITFYHEAELIKALEVKGPKPKFLNQ